MLAPMHREFLSVQNGFFQMIEAILQQVVLQDHKFFYRSPTFESMRF